MVAVESMDGVQLESHLAAVDDDLGAVDVAGRVRDQEFHRVGDRVWIDLVARIRSGVAGRQSGAGHASLAS